MGIMGFLLLGESRVTHDRDGKTGILWFPRHLGANAKQITKYTGVFFIRMDCSPKRSEKKSVKQMHLINNSTIIFYL